MSIPRPVATTGQPRFLGIGAQKAGTTWLCAMLRMQSVGKTNANRSALPRALYEHLVESQRGNVLEVQSLLGWDVSAWLVNYDEWLARQKEDAALAGRAARAAAIPPTSEF
jgi:hypothetical protein